jgi:predicted methyltransferase
MAFRHTACAAVFILGTAAAQAQAPATSPAAAQTYVIPSGTPAYVRAAVQSAERTSAMTTRDALRKPAETLTLSGVEPGQRVIEIAGFGQYYTTLLSAIVGGNGEVHVYDLPYTEQRAGAASRAFADAHPNTTYNVVDYNAAVFPEDVDIVFNVLYYHDLIINDIDTAALNAKLFAALKPGGRYVVIDHKAEDGSGWRDAETLHRMGAEKIVEEVTAAGFVLSVDSDLLANPSDPRTAMISFAPDSRGTTDQAFFIFTKPE